MPKIKITTDTTDTSKLRVALEDLYSKTSAIRETLEQTVGAINLSDPDMATEWELITDTCSSKYALEVLDWVDNIRTKKTVDEVGCPERWQFGMYGMPATVLADVVSRMDAETLRGCILDIDGCNWNTYMVTHTDDIVEAIWRQLPIWIQQLNLIYSKEQRARREGKRRNTCGWSTAYATKQTTLEI